MLIIPNVNSNVILINKISCPLLYPKSKKKSFNGVIYSK